MLVCPDDGGIDHHMLEVWVLRQDLEKILPNAFAGPTIETDEHAIPVAKRAWQITPGRARAQNPKHSIHEQPVVLAGSTSIALLTRNQIRDTRPLHIRQFAPNQDRLEIAILNHDGEP